MRFLSAALLTLTLAFTASAQAPPAPAVEVRLRGVSDLLDRFEYLAKLVDQEDAGNQLAQMVQGFADAKKGIEGIDPARPVGLYATVAPNPVESQVVVVLPIADEKAFLELLTGKLSLDPKKGDNGVYTLQVPNVPLPLFFTFADKSCYVTAATPAALDAKNRFTPKAFFAQDDGSLLSVKVRLDRIPADLLSTFLAQVELKAADSAKDQPAGDAATKAGREFGLTASMLALATAVKEGQELALRLTADPKTDALSADLSLTPKAGSPLAKTLAAVAKRPSVAGTVKPPADAVGVVRLNAQLDGALKEQWTNGIRLNYAKSKADSQKKGDWLPLYDQLWAAVEPTLTSGMFDLAAVALPQGDKGVRVAATASVVGGKKIEAAVKQVAALAPEKDAKFAFDQGSAGPLTLHQVTISDPKFAAATGGPAVWLGTGESRLVLGTETDGAMVKTLAGREPAPAPLLEARASVARVLALGDDALPAAAGKKLVTRVFGDAGPVGKDSVALTVTGGDRLTLSLSMTGKALQLAVLTDKERKKKD